MIITVFEDNDYSSLFPLNQIRASFELRCGAFTNLERIQNSIQIEDEIQLFVRDEIKEVIQKRYPNFKVNPNVLSKGIWLNGAALWSDRHINEIASPKTYTNKNKILALHSDESIPSEIGYDFIQQSASVSIEFHIPFIHNSWDAIFLQSKIISLDAIHFIDFHHGKIHPSAVLENGDNIFIGKNVEIRPGVILDASSGPIILSENVYVDAGAIIQGPIFIGESCVINPGAKLRKNISLGPMCKIGGEVEDSIFEGYSNKQHDGFLGHSHIGQWVNLGANTNNSDLKNNYGLIRMRIGELEFQTDHQFLGSIMGDYVRTGISTMLNTGTIIGLGANVFGSDFQPKYIPPFKWGKSEQTELEKFFQIIEIMKKRRKVKLNEAEKELLSKIYALN